MLSIFTFGTAVCLSIPLVQAEFYTCHPIPKVTEIDCIHFADGVCKDVVYTLTYHSCTNAKSALFSLSIERVPAKLLSRAEWKQAANGWAGYHCKEGDL